MEGTVFEIKKRKTTTLIYYNDIDTTKGQSGSPIYLIRDGIYYLIGVHVGYFKKRKMNVGTAIDINKI